MLLDDCHIAYINLAHRKDRREHMEKELGRVGIKAERFEAISTKGPEWNRYPYRVMFNRTRGAIGCALSQMAVMEKAYELGRSCIVLEDDLIFATDCLKRFEYIVVAQTRS
jgi:GR25 family glycosyltransferase involved in LPS biosynthesis